MKRSSSKSRERAERRSDKILLIEMTSEATCRDARGSIDPTDEEICLISALVAKQGKQGVI